MTSRLSPRWSKWLPTRSLPTYTSPKDVPRCISGTQSTLESLRFTTEALEENSGSAEASETSSGSPECEHPVDHGVREPVGVEGQALPGDVACHPDVTFASLHQHQEAPVASGEGDGLVEERLEQRRDVARLEEASGEVR